MLLFLSYMLSVKPDSGLYPSIVSVTSGGGVGVVGWGGGVGREWVWTLTVVGSVRHMHLIWVWWWLTLTRWSWADFFYSAPHFTHHQALHPPSVKLSVSLLQFLNLLSYCLPLIVVLCGLFIFYQFHCSRFKFYIFKCYLGFTDICKRIKISLDLNSKSIANVALDKTLDALNQMN